MEEPPPVAMLKIIEGFWASRSVYVAAKLGLPDLLKGAKTTEELAATTGMHAPSLYRLLRALVSIGVFAEDEMGKFSLTPLGATLRTDVPGSLRFIVIEELGENHYPAWEKLLYSLKTGAIAFNHVYGNSKWQYMAEHEDEARIFDQAMASFGGATAAAVIEAYDFSASKRVVDLGGGKRQLSRHDLEGEPAGPGRAVRRSACGGSSEQVSGVRGGNVTLRGSWRRLLSIGAAGRSVPAPVDYPRLGRCAFCGDSQELLRGHVRWR